ncbi:cAMP-activated global transcriptional regulator CRP [Burkholderiales bacterium]|nr:cAMP-activated global transcriptional regulator CRP [Burkholderiales bacterium]
MPSSTLRRMLEASAWARTCSPADLDRILSESVVRSCPAGGLVCRKGEPVDHWIGVVDGLVKMANVSVDGKPMSFTGIGTGGWFGEGSLLKDEPRRYDIVALRDSEIAYMPRATFMRLLDTNVAFNRFVLVQLNERLAQFIAMVEHDRLRGPEARLARSLAGLFNPVLYPGIGTSLAASQEELGQLVGLSRQRVNQALKRLEAEGLLRVDYGSVTVLDLARLRNYGE